MKQKKNSGLPGKKRARAFTLIMLAVPLLFFTSLEIALRVFDYGPNLSLFVEEVIGGRTYLIMNPEVKSRYFHKVAFSPNTSMDYFEREKPKDTFRVFCLGGSTTVGFPYGYIGSFSTFMEDRLSLMYPDVNVQIINLGLTATNSYATYDIAREVASYEPDLLVVYDGHNEFYGALGVASHESFVKSHWATRRYLEMIHIRVFLLMRDAMGWMLGLLGSEEDNDSGGTMMERLAEGRYVEYGSDDYRSALQYFRQNLIDLTSLCRERRIPLLLASQASNLRDLKPFVSRFSPTRTQQERNRFHSILNEGMLLFMEGRIDSALGAFEAAMQIDSWYAEGEFMRARCLDSLDRDGAALEAYKRARDYDALRFRTSDDFNQAIRSVCDDSSVIFVDMERALARESPDSLLGNTLMLEHLHPNLRGYFLMAREYVNAMMEMDLPTSTKVPETVSDDSLWKTKSITELDLTAARLRIDALLSAWPFVPTTATVKRNPSPDPIETVALELVTGRTTWEEAHVAAARHYEAIDDIQMAEREYLALVRQIPQNASAYLVLGQMYIRKGQFEKARSILEKSLAVERTGYALRSVGAILVDAGKADKAIPYLEQAFGTSSTSRERAENGYLLAMAYLRTGNTTEAITRLQAVVDIDPTFTPPRELLQRLQAASR